jgi:hypothetical protein
MGAAGLLGLIFDKNNSNLNQQYEKHVCGDGYGGPIKKYAQTTPYI